MIKLTGKSGIAIYVNPDKIIGINEYGDGGGSFVNYGRDQYIVTESPEEVARKVLEYKLAIEDFKVCLTIADAPTRNVERQLMRLASLEESQ